MSSGPISRPKTTSPTFLSDQYPVQVRWSKQQAGAPTATHSYWQIVIVTGGIGMRTSQGRGAEAPSRIQAGDVFVVNEASPIGYAQPQGLDLVAVLFDFKALKMNRWPTRELRGFQELFRSSRPRGNTPPASPPPLHLDETSFRNGIALIEEIEKCSKEKFPCWEMLVEIHFRHLVLLLSRAYDDCLRPHDEAIERMAEIRAHLEQHFREGVDLEHLANEAGMSQRTFYRLFKRATGHAPLAYIIRLRIQHASDQLRNTDRPVTQIAYDAGFSDSNYFTREFRKVIGESPTAYRNRWAD
ncbi:MAG: AraC family transcriptional regulator [Opitutaceae bacterium]|jgi:AraC-like DNA-binding protein